MDKLRRTLTGSATSAVAALLMVGAIAFGATVVRPMTADRQADSTASADAGAGGSDAGEPAEPVTLTADDRALDQHGSGGQCEDELGNAVACSGEEPPSEPPATEPTAQPKDNPAPAPSTHLSLGAGFNADLGKVVVEWSAYGGSFDKYKLVRSTDATVTWPLGDGDQLVDVVGPDGARRFVDGEAPCNTEMHYRAFAVRHTETGYLVLASSNVDGATRACDTATPAEPKALGFEAVQTADGVKLGWDACSSDAFHAYKVVRSATNENPMFPLNDGTELIGVIEDPGTTGFTDTNVSAGQTWTYRVLCMGQNADGWFVIGLTAALTVAVE